jgi:hypothetical protein
MDPNTLRLIQGASGSGGPATYVEDVFQTWLYTGNSSTQTITNGVDLAGKGGLVWTKGRGAFNENHAFVDTARGTNKYLASNNTDAEGTGTQLTSFNSNGYTLGAVNGWEGNWSGRTYASWTFRKQAKFFDVVTYTGNGASQNIAHNLGSTPGCIIIKSTSSTSNWIVYHAGTGATKFLQFNQSNAAGTFFDYWNNTAPTSTQFTLGAAANTNTNGETYVAYLFAHDAGGFGASGSDSVIKCGSFTCDGSGNVGTVNLGWEPQWILTKRTDTTQNWYQWDSMRDWSMSSSSTLSPNLSDSEVAMGSTSYLYPTATGFAGSGNFFGPNANVVYIAIRRGPMKTPTDATKVYNAIARTGTGATGTVTGLGFPLDLVFTKERANAGYQIVVRDRLRGPVALLDSTAADPENTNTTAGITAFNMDGFTVGADGTGSYSSTTNANALTYINWAFRRAPGFFDVVAYTGTGPNQQVTHNLGVIPEMMIIKNRTAAFGWEVYHSGMGTDLIELQSNSFGASANPNWWDNGAPTATVIKTPSGNNAGANRAPYTYIAYLFASCPGVSKVGSYTGTGTTLSIDCGFTTGARFVLIRRKDSGGDWYVWDSARGIVAGNDPYLLLNSTAAEVTGTDYVDTYSAGFEISSTAPAAINANGGSFIFLAVA